MSNNVNSNDVNSNDVNSNNVNSNDIILQKKSPDFLKPPSIEQLNIITLLQSGNVICDAIAGSGKTTTILHIIQHFIEKKILILTFNKKLRFETNEKIDKLRKIYNLGFVECHTYHSYCVKFYDQRAHTDYEIRDILNLNMPKRSSTKFDMIILDEAQDITSLYFELICKIIIDQSFNPKICVLGDKYQSIFDFNGADPRYITLANKIFCYEDYFYNLEKIYAKKNSADTIESAHLSQFPDVIYQLAQELKILKIFDKPPKYEKWFSCKLSISYRSTEIMANFINDCLLYEDRIHVSEQSKILTANILNAYKYSVDYYVYNTFNTRFLCELVISYINANSAEDIFILAPSVKSELSPIRRFANKLSNYGIAIYVPHSDEEKIDIDILKGKLVFSTFHQVKGLERKIVFVLGFDYSYVKYFNGETVKCPNPLYVALTRAYEKLILIHCCDYDYLPYLNLDLLPYRANLIFKNELKVKYKMQDSDFKRSVTKFLKFLPSDVIRTAYNMLQINEIQPASEKIILNAKIAQDTTLYENVSDINGVAIPAYYEYCKYGKLTIYDRVIESSVIWESLDNIRGMKMYNYVKAKSRELPKLCIEHILEIANLYLYSIDRFIYKINQITKYDWLDENLARDLMLRLAFLPQNCIFEKPLINPKFFFNGVADCIAISDPLILPADEVKNNEVKNNEQKAILWEFKCVSELKKEHFLQLAVYALLDDYKSQYKIINLLDNNIYELIPPKKELIGTDGDFILQMVQYLIQAKDTKLTNIPDSEFIKKNINLASNIFYNKPKLIYE